LGQAYFSGNVYLKAFKTNSKPSWSNQITFVALKGRREKTSLMKYQAEFAKVINVGEIDSFVNFPESEKEGMLDNAVSEDFFETFDQAPEDENVGLFKTERELNSSFPVFAFGKTIEIAEIAYMSQNAARPLTLKEKHEVARLKEKKKRETKNVECTTNPAFLNSAKQILTFNIKNTNYTGRISHYSDPGCLGHLSDIYILDVMEDKILKQSFQLFHYQGAI
jgi:hypothetical protein